jgi:hypothetical protein
MKFYWLENKIVVLKSAPQGKKVYFWTGQHSKPMKEVRPKWYKDEAEAVKELNLLPAHQS